MGKREAKAPPPPPLVGLVSEHQGGSQAAGSFYSLVAGSRENQQQAVKLEPGTRNLVLVRALDKESQEEGGLVLHIRCSPRLLGAATVGSEKSRQDSSTIPVKILVTDANDQAPEFVGQLPYVVNISETAPVNSIASRDILAQDKDSAGPFSTIHYKVLHSDQTQISPLQFSNPLEPTLFVSAPLDYETMGPSFTLTITASDQGEPEPLSATTQVQVNIIGK